MSQWNWQPYVSVAQRQARAQKEMDKLRKKGVDIQPVATQGRCIAKSFWGKGWCDHLESFSDYSNRLPRGRSYVRNGSVCHMDINPGRIEAMVSGTELYRVVVDIARLTNSNWESIKERCQGQIGSVIELLQGRLSNEVMAVVTARKEGLFPLPGEISLSCSCPDWATMCKHVAAVLYGVGCRLDSDPALLFLLRQVDPQELITTAVSLPEPPEQREDSLEDAALGDIFGIEFETAPLSDALRKKDITHKVKTEPTSKTRENHRGTAATNKKTKAPRKGRPFVPTGRNIMALRTRLGLTVAEFAGVLGVTPASVYRWEQIPGKLNLQSRSLEELEKLYRDAHSG